MRSGGTALRVAVAAVVALTAGACGGGSPGDDAGRVQVVAGFYPLAEVAERVGGDAVAVANLTPAGAEPHDLEQTTDQVDDILDADVVVYLGRGFQPAVEKAAKRSDAARVDLLAGDDDADPHVWLDPQAMPPIVERVRAALAAADPSRADAFDAGAASYVAELRDLDAAYTQGLADCDRHVIVTAHEAFGRLARRYGLEEIAIAGLSPESEPDPRRMADLAGELRAKGVTTVFAEALVSPKIAETLAREAGVRTAVLDPIEGLSRGRLDAGATYLSVMRENLAALRLALGCR
jgi:zinc transport system substrate-binding protein